MNLSGQRMHDMLFDAFIQGFLLEHGAKSVSRYPMAGYSMDSMRELLRPVFNDWLRTSPQISDAEGAVLEGVSNLAKTHFMWNYLAGMRDAKPGLCWAIINNGANICILDRGHDNGRHENTGP